jgi:hypothetical protein
VAFYVEQHNTVMPHQAFNGHTPEEIHFGTRPELEQERSNGGSKLAWNAYPGTVS